MVKSLAAQVGWRKAIVGRSRNQRGRQTDLTQRSERTPPRVAKEKLSAELRANLGVPCVKPEFRSSGSTPAPGVAGRALVASIFCRRRIPGFRTFSRRRCFPRGRRKHRPWQARSPFYFGIRVVSHLRLRIIATPGRRSAFRVAGTASSLPAHSPGGDAEEAEHGEDSE